MSLNFYKGKIYYGKKIIKSIFYNDKIFWKNFFEKPTFFK